MKKGSFEVKRYDVSVIGIRPLMFDKYAGDNQTQLKVEDKMYFMPDGMTICIPSTNILSLLGSTIYPSAAKLVCGKGYQAFANAASGFTDIIPLRIPVLDVPGGKEIEFHGFDGERFYEDFSVARIKKTAGVFVPNPKHRPVLNTPWALDFRVEIMPNNDGLDGPKLRTLFEVGGLGIGIGTWRSRYGKFTVAKWDEV